MAIHLEKKNLLDLNYILNSGILNLWRYSSGLTDKLFTSVKCYLCCCKKTTGQTWTTGG